MDEEYENRTMIPTVRTLAYDDINDVLDLFRRTEHIGLDESDAPARIRKFLDRNEGLSLVATVNEAIVGAVMSSHDTRRGYIYHLAVDENFRRRGISRKLIHQCLYQFQQYGINKCHVHIYKANEYGQLFWKPEGWELRDDIDIYSKFI